MLKKIIFILVSILTVFLILYTYIGEQIISKYPPEAKNIIRKYGINKLTVQDAQSKSFLINNKTIHFIHVEYGKPEDCPSGCHFSHICTIVDDNKDYLYRFIFNNQNEDVLKINNSYKNTYYNSYRYDGNYGKDQLIGKSHSLTKDKEFIKFEENYYNNSEFRWCTNT